MTEQFTITTTTKIPRKLLQRKLIAEIFSCCDQYQQVQACSTIQNFHYHCSLRKKKQIFLFLSLG